MQNSVKFQLIWNSTHRVQLKTGARIRHNKHSGFSHSRYSRRKNRNEPEKLLIPKHIHKIFVFTKTETTAIWSTAEYWRTECFCIDKNRQKTIKLCQFDSTFKHINFNNESKNMLVKYMTHVSEKIIIKKQQKQDDHQTNKN